MNSQALQKYTAVGLAVLGLFLFRLTADFGAEEMVDVRIMPLVILSGLGLIALAQITLTQTRQPTHRTETDNGPDNSNLPGWRLTDLLWLAVPVIIGLLFAY